MAFDPGSILENLAALPDENIDIAAAALALAARVQPGISLDRYRNHLEKISQETISRHRELLDAGAQDDIETKLAALKHVIADTHGYAGDEETYDDLQNASLIRMIERRKGLPITLGILYMHAARAAGWTVSGIDFPGHFLCRIEQDGRRIIFDPFYGCKILQASDMRGMIKRLRGAGAELSADYFAPASNRSILIRLQNNIKYRQIGDEDYAGALQTVEGMRFIDPNEFRLLLDAGVLYARTGHPEKAVAALEDYIKRAPNPRDRHDAALLLQELQDQLK
ncbi:MAG: transglutaminase family protein [Alphaproteobacteria bacterium]|nr:transglutaminase family protein [Alphaproteobacteria bacterium]